MLNVQTYLRSGKTLADLKTELGINAAVHPTLPLVILNYDQIDSPKTDKIVRECRGLVLNSQNWEIVAKSMHRFFNWGEVADEMPLFNFENFVVDSKEDGSLCILYHFNGEWHGNTRGSFALDPMQFQAFTWREAFLKAMGMESWDQLNGVLDPEVTYICEFVSPWNKVVRTYYEPKLYLLAAFKQSEELHWDEVDKLTANLFLRPERFHYKSIDEIIAFLNDMNDEYELLPKPEDEVFPRHKLVKEGIDPTFEGVVIRDDSNRRWKIKSPLYLSLHRMRGEGDNLYNPKHLIPWILKNEGDELLTYFPEVTVTYREAEGKVNDAYAQLESVWLSVKDIPVDIQMVDKQGVMTPLDVKQKDFAAAIAKKTPFTGILFELRKKYGVNQTLEQLKAEWRLYGDGILKVLFKK